MSVLERKLVELIAEDLGVAPEQVTAEFIHEQREKLSPRIRLVLDTKYGGYSAVGLTILSDDEVEANRREAEIILAQYSSK